MLRILLCLTLCLFLMTDEKTFGCDAQTHARLQRLEQAMYAPSPAPGYVPTTGGCCGSASIASAPMSYYAPQPTYAPPPQTYSTTTTRYQQSYAYQDVAPQPAPVDYDSSYAQSYSTGYAYAPAYVPTRSYYYGRSAFRSPGVYYGRGYARGFAPVVPVVPVAPGVNVNFFAGRRGFVPGGVHHGGHHHHHGGVGRRR
jgi:hypothetical protein